MAYAGYLLKIGNFTIPTSIIKADSYYAYDNMQDYEPWTDATGHLHRDVVELKALKVEFETIPMLTDTQFASFMSSIKSQFTNVDARECNITAYIPTEDKYVTQKGYMADVKPQIYFADQNKIQYDAIRFAFIGGVSPATD